MQRLTHIQNECADNDLLKLKGDFYSTMNESCLFILVVNASVNCKFLKVNRNNKGKLLEFQNNSLHS